ncbi:MAG: hypothetical protein AB7F09_17230 [Parvibaculaceae bacterium]
MKMMKWALLGGAALAVTATAARADDLGDLKAQIEALQTRVSQLEAQPQASMPSGYSLLTFRDGQGNFDTFSAERYADRVRDESGFTLSVMPTADAAPVAEVSVSGEIRTALIYNDVDSDTDAYDDELDLNVRGRIFIRGKADTAVGEVGGYFRLEAQGGAGLDSSSTAADDYVETTTMDKAYGWWKFAPNWELMAGVNDMTASLQVGWDWMAATGPVNSFGPSQLTSNEQMRLTYASGPLSFAIAIEDPDNISTETATIGFADGDADGVIDPTNPLDQVPVLVSSPSDDKSDIPNVQAYLMYSSDAFTAQVVGLYQDDEFGSSDWAIGGGANLGIADAFTLTAAAVVGEGTSGFGNNLGPLTTDEDFWAASVGLIVNISEDTRLELGAGIEDYDVAGEALGFGGGIYWDPVSQLTLGVGATYVDYDDLTEFDVVDTQAGPGVTPEAVLIDSDDTDSLQIFFGTWFRFP